MANAASVTRKVKKFVDDAETSVTTHYVHNGTEGHPVWQTWIFVEQHKHDAVTARLSAGGLINVTSHEGFLNVIQPAD